MLVYIPSNSDVFSKGIWRDCIIEGNIIIRGDIIISKFDVIVEMESVCIWMLSKTKNIHYYYLNLIMLIDIFKLYNQNI
jgi:hypothetical protein